MERPNRKPNRLEDYDYSQNGAYFITICTRDRKKILSQIVGTPLPGCPQKPSVKLLWHGEIADKQLIKMGNFYNSVSIDKYVIMPDHIHLLISICNKDGHPQEGCPYENIHACTVCGNI